MCTEFGSADIVGGITEAEKRQFEQEMIELCYGEPDFWKNAPLADKAYPSRGTPAGRRISWSLWYLNGNNETQWANSSRWTDIWTYAAEMQASPPPEPLTPNPPNVYPEGKIITAYPNPFSLKSASPVKFHIGSAAGGEIKIFTVSSRLVKKIAVPEGDSNVLWDCLNKDSEKIAPGLYLYSFSENNGAKTTGKIAIIK
ncbi:MAG: hypothetical protein A2297_04450 [Elusimicrobia bacterium RIFOXYB2_FULL_48_7]|nr:MAG: hypothetical protein A2297_04450 [Elusimicrobia bacterium RIFOXYB2_FULL_48_7]